MNTYETIETLLPLIGLKGPDMLGEGAVALLSRALVHPKTNALVAYVDASGELKNMSGQNFATIGSQDIADILAAGADAGGRVLRGLGAPSAASDAATKGYTDAALLSLRNRTRVRVATTANLSLTSALASGQTVDGVTLAAGNLVLVKNQSAPAENGIYVVPSSGTASRSVEFDTFDEHAGLLCAVEEGAASGDSMWLCISNEGGALGSTAISFSRVGIGLLPANNLSDVQSLNVALSNLSQGKLSVVSGAMNVIGDLPVSGNFFAPGVYADGIMQVGSNSFPGIFLITDGAGGDTTISAATGGFNLALPSANGTLAMNAESFSVVKSSNQAVAVTTLTAITWQTEKWDTGNWFASSKFTPQRAGKYRFNVAINLTGGAPLEYTVYLFKNGAIEKVIAMEYRSLINPALGTCLASANGSTDYFEIGLFYYGTGPTNVLADDASTYFQGEYVGA
jgi:hypothetical protein